MNLERIPDQVGYLLLTEDGAVISVSIHLLKITFAYSKLLTQILNYVFLVLYHFVAFFICINSWLHYVWLLGNSGELFCLSWSCTVICCINRFTSLSKNLFNLLEFLVEAFRCTFKHWKWCTWHRKASARNSSKLNKFLYSEVNKLIQHKNSCLIDF